MKHILSRDKLKLKRHTLLFDIFLQYIDKYDIKDAHNQSPFWQDIIHNIATDKDSITYSHTEHSLHMSVYVNKLSNKYVEFISDMIKFKTKLESIGYKVYKTESDWNDVLEINFNIE